ncbi:enoyl-CoA hydratase-related protein [Sphingomonas sp. ID0503]|uniref:enoyl-CoA hydratase-related protein n=1 Tax=Sphingomonas sp. ID0503 TaxID=3399691 RepID=UPI003AFAC0F8
MIAAVNGIAAGAGMAIAVAADMRIASPTSRFLVASVRIGLSAGESRISYHLPCWIGAGRAFADLLTGRPNEREEAVMNCLALRMVEADQLEEAALAQATTICADSPFPVAETKLLMWRSLDALS